MKAKPESFGSERPQKVVLAQGELERKIARAAQEVTGLQRRISEAEAKEDAWAKSVGAGYYVNPENQRLIATEIVGMERQKAKIEKDIEALKAEIKALQPSVAQIAERKKKLASVAKTARGRQWKAAEVHRNIVNLRKTLREYANLGRQMRASLAALEFDLSGDALDLERFEALARSLPDGLENQSEAWLASFLGQPQAAKPCRFLEGQLVRRESLAHCGVYRDGDIVLLTEAEVIEINQLFRKVQPIGWQVREAVPAAVPEATPPRRRNGTGYLRSMI